MLAVGWIPELLPISRDAYPGGSVVIRMRNGVGRKDGGERLLAEAGKGALPAGHCRLLCRRVSRVHSGRGQQEEALKAGGAERAWLKSEVIWKQEVQRGQLIMTFAC